MIEQDQVSVSVTSCFPIFLPDLFPQSLSVFNLSICSVKRYTMTMNDSMEFFPPNEEERMDEDEQKMKEESGRWSRASLVCSRCFLLFLSFSLFLPSISLFSLTFLLSLSRSSPRIETSCSSLMPSFALESNWRREKLGMSLCDSLSLSLYESMTLRHSLWFSLWP